MAVELRDLNSLRVEMDLARHPPTPPTTQAPAPGPEMVEEIAEETGGGGLAGPSVMETTYPGINEGSVLLAPPGFTVCESFFDSGEFTCFNPEVVFGTEVQFLPNGSFSMGDAVWCNVTIENGKIKAAGLATEADAEATVSVHVADIRSDGVKQYHVGAIIVSEGGGGGGVTPDDVSTEFVPHDPAPDADNSDEGKLQVKGFVDAPVGTVPIVANVDGKKVLRWGLTGNFGLYATKSGAGWTYTVNGGYYIKARTATWVSGDLTVSSSGIVYLKVPMGTGSGESAVLEHSASSLPSSSSTYTYIPLYYLNTSGSVSDYRCQPHIQVWE